MGKLRESIKEAYNRKDRIVLHDIIEICKCSSLEDADIQLMNKKYFIDTMRKKFGDTFNDEVRLEILKVLINDYQYFTKYDDEREASLDSSNKFKDQVLDFVKNNFTNVEYKESNWSDYLTHDIYFDSDLSFDEVLDMFQNNFDIKIPSMGFLRGGSATAYDYVTPDGVSMKIDSRPSGNHDYKVSIFK